jgi:hypothetical protein
MPRRDDVVDFKLRMRKSTHKKIAAAAKKNYTTLNGELNKRIEESFRADERWEDINSRISHLLEQIEHYREALRKERHTMVDDDALAFILRLVRMLPEPTFKDPELAAALDLARKKTEAAEANAPDNVSPVSRSKRSERQRARRIQGW